MNTNFVPLKYQVEGASFLAKRGGLLGDAVGLGKTAQAIMACIWRNAEKVLVICPKSLKQWWVNEIANVEKGVSSGPSGHSQMAIQCVTTGLWPSVTAEIEGRKRLYIISHYDQYTNRYLKKNPWAAEEFDVIILDEAQAIQNRKAQRTKNIKKIKTRAKIALTADPVVDRPDSLWSILNWLDKREWPSYWSFVNSYCEIDKNYRGVDVVGGLKALPVMHMDGKVYYSRELTAELLKSEVKGYLLVRSLDDVGVQLPEIREQRVPLSMENEQKKFYDKLARETFIDLSNWRDENKMTVWDYLSSDNPDKLYIKNCLSRFVRHQQVVSDPTVFDTTIKDNAKLDWLEDFVQSTKEPALILTNFRHTAQTIVDFFEKNKLSVFSGWDIDYGKPKPDQYIVGTWAKLAEGQNFQHLRLAVAWDMPLARIKWAQGKGRIHRLGQKRGCVLYKLIVGNSVDEDVEKLVNGKQRDVDIIISWLKRLYEEYKNGKTDTAKNI